MVACCIAATRRSLLEHKDEEGLTALMLACVMGHHAAAGVLLKVGEDDQKCQLVCCKVVAMELMGGSRLLRCDGRREPMQGHVTTVATHL